MLRLSRSLATRLRRATTLSPRSQAATAADDAWQRVERGLAISTAPAHAARRRELAEENLRPALALIGQQGRPAMARMVALVDETGADGAPRASRQLARQLLLALAAATAVEVDPIAVEGAVVS